MTYRFTTADGAELVPFANFPHEPRTGDLIEHDGKPYRITKAARRWTFKDHLAGARYVCTLVVEPETE